MTVTNPHFKLFDGALSRKRRARLSDETIYNHRLHCHLSDILLERLQFIRHDFQTTLVIGDFPLKGLQAYGDITHLHHGIIKNSKMAFPKSVIGESDFLPFSDQSYDLIIHYFELHRTNDIPGAMAQIQRILKPKGLFLAVMLGGDSLWELRNVCHKAEERVRGGVSPRVAPMVSVYDAAALMQRAGFSLPVVDHQQFVRSYNDSLECLKDLKQLGLSNILCSQEKGLMGKSLFQEILLTYQSEFFMHGKVPCTFDVIFLSGWKE